MTPRRIAIVGAGMTGLALAHRLLRRARAEGRAIDVRVFEAAPRAGGHAHTVRANGFLIEAGPNGFLDRHAAALALADELGLTGELIAASPAANKRFVVRGGRLRRAPDSPATLLTSDALSVAGRLRVLAEPLVPRRREPGEETVHAFARRRLGREAADALVDPMIAGISAGDSRELSVGASFPLMAEMEREHGSLIRALLARRRSGIAAPRLVALRGGMDQLVAALAREIGASLSLGVPIARLGRAPGGNAWRLVDSSGAAHEADDVVLATPARAAAAIVEAFDPELGRRLAATRFAGVAVVALGYRVAQVPRPLDGYGYLLTRDEGCATLGVVWESSLFTGRAPEGHVLLRAILGGARRPEVVGVPASERVALARRELEAVLGVTGEPVVSWSLALPDAISQHVVGHAARVARARERAAGHGALWLAGTSYDGNSFAGAVESGRAMADTLLDRRESAP